MDSNITHNVGDPWTFLPAYTMLTMSTPDILKMLLFVPIADSTGLDSEETDRNGSQELLVSSAIPSDHFDKSPTAT